MTVAEPSFDLLTQPWVPALDRGGTPREVSLVEVFAQAHELRGLSGDLPTQVFATTRLLLAILHRALSGPRDLDEWCALWDAPTLPAAVIEDYLGKWSEHFDLLHPSTPFLQVADLHTAKGEVSDLARLIADVPNGNKFFTTRQGPLSLGYAEAARWLVHCHAYDPSGIKSGAVGDSRVKGGKGYPIGTGWCGYLGGVLAEGQTLRETLLLNLVAHDQLHNYDPADDLPPWERDQPGAAEREDGVPVARGPVDLFTWQSRRIRLVAADDRVSGVLICNGDRITPQNRHHKETHSGWRRSKAQEAKRREDVVYMPAEHTPERMIWRGLSTIVPQAHAGTTQRSDAAPRMRPGVLEWVSELEDNRAIPEDLLIGVHVYGMTYGAQSSVTTEVVDDSLVLRSVLLNSGSPALISAVLDCVVAAENSAYALGSFAANLAIASGDGGKGAAGRTRALETAYDVLDPHFRQWLSGITTGSDSYECQVHWHGTVRRLIRALGEELHAAAPPNAWVGHVDNGRLITSAVAYSWFTKALKEALPYAHKPTKDTDG
ncbi:type I-E CRISPR-associated protein Cse1/CasA [Actinokineospora sp. HUAS TT18]|uniref:type I-E CRISPR-associated protein Cse1/CasA n=1 Tax=Actinokineospora sp. HUAS TT18 TaxID=3447451 RepID=UPI003F527661